MPASDRRRATRRPGEYVPGRKHHDENDAARARQDDDLVGSYVSTKGGTHGFLATPQ
jgi:hypothetical protein